MSASAKYAPTPTTPETANHPYVVEIDGEHFRMTGDEVSDLLTDLLTARAAGLKAGD